MNTDQLLRQCRFSKRYQGYYMLQECIRIVLENEDSLLHITGIYKKAAEKFDISWSCVERDIRTVLDYSMANGGKEQLEKLTGGILYSKPTVGEVIELMSCYLKEHPEE